jgi:hypothetical protein
MVESIRGIRTDAAEYNGNPGVGQDRVARRASLRLREDVGNITGRRRRPSANAGKYRLTVIGS